MVQQFEVHEPDSITSSEQFDKPSVNYIGGDIVGSESIIDPRKQSKALSEKGIKSNVDIAKAFKKKQNK